MSVICSSFVAECYKLWRRIPTGSNIQEANVFRVAGDETAAGLDVFAHQNREQLVSGGRVVEGDLAQHPDVGIHRRLPKFLGVHLTKTLVPLDTVFGIDLRPRRATGFE